MKTLYCSKCGDTVQLDTTIEVISIVEQDDGGAIVQLEMGSEAIRLLVQKAFVDILTGMMEEE